MKHRGCKTEHESDRINALISAYRRELGACRRIDNKEIWRRVVEMPCRRFWVSDYRAAIVISAMLRGESLEGMRPTKREMYEEICRRTVKRLKESPGTPLLHAVGEVVSEEAPKFYMTPGTARVMYYNEKRRLRRAKANMANQTNKTNKTN